MKKLKFIIRMVVAILPSKIKIFYYRKVKGWHIGDCVYIGMSYMEVGRLYIGDNSRIGHLNVVKGIDSLELRGDARVGNLNWITGFPKNNSQHFAHVENRDPSLYIMEHASITNRHLVDCTSSVTIGKFSTVGGFRSQLLTHSINFKKCIQDSSSIMIGDYCFVGTSSILLPGAYVPNFSIVAAGSVVNKSLIEEMCIYAGTPVKIVGKIDASEWKYFSRLNGRVG